MLTSCFTRYLHRRCSQISLETVVNDIWRSLCGWFALLGSSVKFQSAVWTIHHSWWPQLFQRQSFSSFLWPSSSHTQECFRILARTSLRCHALTTGIYFYPSLSLTKCKEPDQVMLFLSPLTLRVKNEIKGRPSYSSWPRHEPSEDNSVILHDLKISSLDLLYWLIISQPYLRVYKMLLLGTLYTDTWAVINHVGKKTALFYSTSNHLTEKFTIGWG